MAKKTIWVINQTAGKPTSGWGERHYSMAQYWVQEGYEVKLISGSYNHLFINQPTIANKMFTYEHVAEGIEFCWVKIPIYKGGSVFKLWSMLVFALKVLFLNGTKLGKPNIIIVSSMPIFPILSGIYLKRKWKAQQLIVEIRDLWPLTPLYLSNYSKFHPMIVLMKWIEKRGYKKADTIVSLLPNAATYINAISKDPRKFHWISNGIEPTLGVDDRLPPEILHQLPSNKFIIGYTGTMGMANALEYLVEAAVLLKNDASVHFVLVGDGYLKTALQQKTVGQPNITFIPKIPKSQVQQLISHFDCCFIGRNNTPLFDYGVASNKYFDYMLAKKPILESSNLIKSPAELSGCGLHVTPEDPAAIVEGIKKLQNYCSKDLDKMGEKGYLYVLKYHNFEFLSSKYLRIFNNEP